MVTPQGFSYKFVKTHTHSLSLFQAQARYRHIYLHGSAVFFCRIAGLASLSISHSAALSFFDKSSTSELRKQVQTLQKEENQIRNIQAGNQNKVCCSTKNHSFFILSSFLSLFPLSLAPQKLISPLGSLVWYNNLYKCIQERRMDCHVVTHD